MTDLYDEMFGAVNRWDIEEDEPEDVYEPDELDFDFGDE